MKVNMQHHRLNLGCGYDIREGYTNMDIAPVSDRVVKHDVEDLSDFADNSVSEILAYDIIEHFSIEKIHPIIAEWSRVLHPGGILVIQTPDIEEIFNEFYKKAKSGNITWARLSAIIHGKNEPFQVHYVSLSFPWLKQILHQHGMKVVSKKITVQNMLIKAEKIADSDFHPPEPETVMNYARVIDSEKCKKRLRLYRRIRKLYKKKILRITGLNKAAAFLNDRFLFPPAKGPTMVPSNYGFDIVVDPTFEGTTISYLKYKLGLSMEGTAHVLNTVLPAKTAFIDIDSGEGLTSLLAAKALPPEGKVYSFESNPAEYKALSLNIKFNKLDNIKACPFSFDFTENKDTSGDDSASTLNDFIKNNQIESVGMLRLSVEKWANILRNLEILSNRSKAPVISIKCGKIVSLNTKDITEMFEFIKDVNNYSIFKLEKGKRAKSLLVEINHNQMLTEDDEIYCLFDEHKQKYKNLIKPKDQ